VQLKTERAIGGASSIFRHTPRAREEAPWSDLRKGAKRQVGFLGARVCSCGQASKPAVREKYQKRSTEAYERSQGNDPQGPWKHTLKDRTTKIRWVRTSQRGCQGQGWPLKRVKRNDVSKQRGERKKAGLFIYPRWLEEVRNNLKLSQNKSLFGGKKRATVIKGSVG